MRSLRLDASVSQVALRYVNQLGGPFVTRSSNAAHLADDLDTSWPLHVPHSGHFGNLSGWSTS